MGRWSTYRRRGSSPSFRDGLSLPATPVLTIGANIQSTTTLNGNTGGQAEIWKAASEFGTYSLEETFTWVQVVNFGPAGTFAPGWLKTQNVGDGLNRKGRSPFSNAVEDV